MRNPVLRPALLCTAFALASCSGVASNLAFHPPAGWSGTPSMFGRMQMWVKQGRKDRNGQFVMLVRSSLDSANLFQTAQFGRGSATDVKHSIVSICNGRQAEYVTAIGVNGKQRTKLEAVIADVGDSKYMALYARDFTAPADSQAEDAIHSLCPKG
jgi:hypothetical protein